jgi:hypothetical protein
MKQRSTSLITPCVPCVAWLVQVTATNVDISRVAPTYHLYSVEEVEAVIGRL